MSSTPDNPDTTDTEESTADEKDDDWVEKHRDQLEREAASDGPHAWVCERILATHDQEEGEA